MLYKAIYILYIYSHLFCPVGCYISASAFVCCCKLDVHCCGLAADMMDGRIGAVRDALDAEGFTDIGIIGSTLI